MLMRRDYERMTGAATGVLGGLFLIAALAHATDGFTDSVARALPSTIIGFVVGATMLVAAFGLLSHRLWAFRTAIAGHVMAIAAVLFAMFSVEAGYGDGRPSLAIPAAMLILLVANCIALWRARPRNPVRRMKHEIAAKMY